MKVIWDYLCHGFKALAEGVHPENDPYGDPWPAHSPQEALAGTPIAGGRFQGGVWAISGDLEYVVLEWGGHTGVRLRLVYTAARHVRTRV